LDILEYISLDIVQQTSASAGFEILPPSNSKKVSILPTKSRFTPWKMMRNDWICLGSFLGKDRKGCQRILELRAPTARSNSVADPRDPRDVDGLFKCQDFVIQGFNPSRILK
jgi:hypothetical protein